MNSVKVDYVDAIDKRVAIRHLLLHPFYKAWTQGELSLQALQDYAKQYYHHVAAFPTYLSAVHSHTDDVNARRRILANLVDEEDGDPNHPELWLRFAKMLGVGADEVRRTPAIEETVKLIGAFRSICATKTTVEGLAALYAYESMVPSVAESKIDGLKKFYDFDDPAGLAYFEVHIEADKRHAADERKLLESYVSEENAPQVMRSVDDVLGALWEMLSGIGRRHGIVC